MSGRDVRPPLAAAATDTNRRDLDENQDAFVVLTEAADGCTGVVVADGVGSLARSGLASRAAADAAALALRTLGPGEIQAAFDAAWPAVRALAPAGVDPEADAATTLLIGLVNDGVLHLGYVGNGALLTVTAVPGGAPESGQLHWTNHLLPHSGYEHGHEVLTRCYTASADGPPRPVHVTLDLDVPSALLVVSDGIWSDEQNPLARTPDGMRWSQRPPILTKTLELAASLLAGLPADGESLTIEAQLTDHLGWLRAEGLLEDDATIGLVLT